ncbi:hypothetical protein ACQ9ZH_21140 [Pseudomonas chlororaphis]
MSTFKVYAVLVFCVFGLVFNFWDNWAVGSIYLTYGIPAVLVLALVIWAFNAFCEKISTR